MEGEHTGANYKWKGDAAECDLYRGIKLLDHAMKVVEKVLEERLRRVVKISACQCGFMPGKGTIDAIYVVRRMMEKHEAKGKKLYLCFVDLRKAFDRVPRSVIAWALRKSGVVEGEVRAVMRLYEGVKTRVRVGDGVAEAFDVNVGVQGRFLVRCCL